MFGAPTETSKLIAVKARLALAEARARDVEVAADLRSHQREAALEHHVAQTEVAHHLQMPAVDAGAPIRVRRDMAAGEVDAAGHRVGQDKMIGEAAALIDLIDPHRAPSKLDLALDISADQMKLVLRMRVRVVGTQNQPGDQRTAHAALIVGRVRQLHVPKLSRIALAPSPKRPTLRLGQV